MGKRSWVGDVALILIVLLIAGRVINLPLALFLVSGNSMYPVLKTGDLVVGEAVYLVDYHVGDIVVWYRTFSYGVIHKVVSISDGTVVTRGINNPVADPPIPSSYVKYKVVLHISRSIWLTALAAVAGVYSYYRRRKIVEAFKSPEPDRLTVAWWLLAFFILLDLAVISLSTVYYDSYRVSVQPPIVTLKSVTLLPDKPMVRIVYNVNGTSITGVDECNITVGDASYKCSMLGFTSNAIYIGIPLPSIYSAIQQNGVTGVLDVYVRVLLKNGNLTGKYSVRVTWRPIRITVVSGKVVVSNPNYLPVNITVRTQYYTVKGGMAVFLNETIPKHIDIPPHSNETITISRIGSFAYVIVSYPYKPGSSRIVEKVVEVDFT